ncbi:MAG: hypothetical protein AAB967_02315 [Patescibacteria group bacterium]
MVKYNNMGKGIFTTFAAGMLIALFLALDLGHARAEFGAPDSNTSPIEVPGKITEPFTNFFESIRGIGGSTEGSFTMPNVSLDADNIGNFLRTPEEFLRSIDAWLEENIGVSISGILRGIGRVFIFLLNIVAWVVGLVIRLLEGLIDLVR